MLTGLDCNRATKLLKMWLEIKEQHTRNMLNTLNSNNVHFFTTDKCCVI